MPALLTRRQVNLRDTLETPQRWRGVVLDVRGHLHAGRGRCSRSRDPGRMRQLATWTERDCAPSEDCEHRRQQQAAQKSHTGLFRSSDLHSYTVRRNVMHCHGPGIRTRARLAPAGERLPTATVKSYVLDARHPKRERPRLLDARPRSEEHTSELQSHVNLVCRLLLEKKKK